MSKKRIHALLLCVLMLVSTVLMCACNSETDPTGDDSGNATYKVTVVDGAGVPYTEKIIVKFVQGDNQIAMVPINKQGVAEKELAKGDYSVVVDSTDSKLSFYYDAQAAKLTAEKTEITVSLANEVGEEFATIQAAVTPDGDVGACDAYYVSAGSTHLPLAEGERNYLLFTPKEAGTYEFTVTGNAATIGIYGASIHYIQNVSVEEVVDNKITVSVHNGMIGTGETGTTVYVIGLDAVDGAKDCIVNILRTGDAGWSFAEEPWTNYQPKTEITDYTLPDGIALKDFDLTAADGTYNLVLNEQTGCYHINSVDGPQVFVQLANEMRGISLMKMVGEIVYQDGVLQQTGSAPFRYSYDNGKDDFFKEDYTDVMRQYVTARDKKSGVYPLNEDLFYILPLGIKSLGWCREDTVNYLFRDEENLNPEYLWMFLLVHQDAPIPEYAGGNEDTTDPTEPTTEPTEPETDVTKPTDPVTKPTEPVTPGTCNHKYSTATCQKPQTCTLCGATKGTVADHSYADATCDKPQTCKTCGKTNGKALGHSYVLGTCSRCGGKDSGYKAPVEDNKDEPIVAVPTQKSNALYFDAEVKANHLVYYHIPRVDDTTLRIESKNAYVVYEGKTYLPENGVVTVPDLVCDNWNPVALAIGNMGSGTATFSVKLTYPSGHSMNPISLKLGSFTTEVEKGNETGVFYTWKATKTGKLTLKLDSITKGVTGNITLYNLSSYKNINLSENGDGDTITIDVKAGETVQITVGAMPKNNRYPAATIKVTASFA